VGRSLPSSSKEACWIAATYFGIHADLGHSNWYDFTTQEDAPPADSQATEKGRKSALTTRLVACLFASTSACHLISTVSLSQQACLCSSLQATASWGSLPSSPQCRDSRTSSKNCPHTIAPDRRLCETTTLSRNATRRAPESWVPKIFKLTSPATRSLQPTCSPKTVSRQVNERSANDRRHPTPSNTRAATSPSLCR
jgi:hypothetical protein